MIVDQHEIDATAAVLRAASAFREAADRAPKDSDADRRGFLRGLEAAETIISNAQYLGKGARDPLLDAIRALKTTRQEG